MTTAYYARIDENPKSKTYGKKQSVHRMIREGDTLLVERWDGSKWVDNPNLIRHTGIGGDEDYKKIGESEAKKFIKSKKLPKKLKNFLIIIKGGPGSGHFGHAGRPPKRGGSLPGSGVGAALSIGRGKHARARQWLRSQGMSKKDVDDIERVGVMDHFPMIWLSNRHEWVREVGIAEVKPVIDAYLGKDPNRAITKIVMVRELRNWADPIDSIGRAVSPEVKGLQTQMQARLEAGKPVPGDAFYRQFGPGMTWLGMDTESRRLPGVWTVERIDADGDIHIVNPWDEVEVKTPQQFRLQFVEDKRIEAVVDPQLETIRRLARGHLAVGDKFMEGEEVLEVVEVGVGRFGNLEAIVEDIDGRRFIRHPEQIRENARPFMSTGDLAPLVADVGLTQRIAEGNLKIGDKVMVTHAPVVEQFRNVPMEVIRVDDDGWVTVKLPNGQNMMFGPSGAVEDFKPWETPLDLGDVDTSDLAAGLGQAGLAGRIAAGKLVMGDKVIIADSLHSGSGAFEVIEIEMPGEDAGWVRVENVAGDKLWIHPDKVQEYARIPGQEIIGLATAQRFAAGELVAGDEFIFEGEGSGVWRVVEVDTQYDEMEMLIEDPEGDQQWWHPRHLRGGVKPVKGAAPPSQKVVERIRADVVGESTLNLMRNGDIQRLDTLSRVVNAKGISRTYAGVTEDGTQVLVKDSTGGKNISEVLAYDLTHAAGLEGLVTQAVIRDHPGELGMVARVWADGETISDLRAWNQLSDFEDLVVEQDFEMLGILDVLGGQTDRHMNNIILTGDGRVNSPDNDYYFSKEKGASPYFKAENYIENTFGRLSYHYQAVTGGQVRFNSATIRAAVDNVRNSASILTSIEDAVGSTELYAFKVRLQALEDYADMLDENWGGSKTIKPQAYNW